MDGPDTESTGGIPVETSVKPKIIWDFPMIPRKKFVIRQIPLVMAVYFW